VDQMKYLRALRARWIWIIGATVVLAVIGGVIPVPKTTDAQTNSLADATKTSHGHYTATAVLGLPPNASTNAAARLTALGFYAQSSAVQQGIIKRLAFTGDPKVLAKAITIVQPSTAQTNTGSVQVIGKGGTPAQAAAVANAYGDSLSAYLASLSSQNTATTLAAAQKQVTNLQNQINAIGSQISAIAGSRGTTEAVIAANPQLVTLIAQRNALQASYTSAFQTLSQAQTANTNAPAIVALQRADPATAVHVGPRLSAIDRRWVRIVIGLLIGFVLSVLFVLLRAFFDRRLSSRAAVELACEAPVLAEIARFSVSGGMQDVAVVSAPQSRTAEAYRLLRTVVVAWTGLGPNPQGAAMSPHRADDTGRGGALAILAGGRGSHDGVLLPRDSGHPWRLVVLGSVCGEKSHPTVVANIAAAIAETGRTVLVVRTSGGREAFSGGGRDHGALVVHPTGVEGVRTIDLHSAGHDKQDPSDVLTALGGHADLLLVDAGPALTAHDVVSFGALSQGIVITAQFHSTPQEEAERCGQLLRRAGVPFRGVVFTDVPRKELLGGGASAAGNLPLDVRPSGVERLSLFEDGDAAASSPRRATASPYATATPASPLTALRGKASDQPIADSRAAAASNGVDTYAEANGVASNGVASHAGSLNGTGSYPAPDRAASDRTALADPAWDDAVVDDRDAEPAVGEPVAGEPAVSAPDVVPDAPAARASVGRSPLDRTSPKRSPLDQDARAADPVGVDASTAKSSGPDAGDTSLKEAVAAGAGSADTDLLGTDPLSAEHRAARRFGRSPLDTPPAADKIVVSEDAIDLTKAPAGPRKERSFGGRRRRSPLDDDRPSS
jgi:capsular polysaccharide biosynthesis protein/Mrp family chromosome partitioning ATPase